MPGGENVINTISGGAQHGPVLIGRDFEFKMPLPDLSGRPVSLPPWYGA